MWCDVAGKACAWAAAEFMVNAELKYFSLLPCDLMIPAESF